MSCKLLKIPQICYPCKKFRCHDRKRYDWEFLNYQLSEITDIDAVIKILHKEKRDYNLFWYGPTVIFYPKTKEVLDNLSIYGKIQRYNDVLWPKKE